MSCCWGIGLGTLPAWPLWSHQHKPKYPKNEPHLWVSRTFVLPDVGPLKHLVGPSRVPTTGIIITDVAQSDPKSLGLLANTWCMTWVDTWLVAWLHRRNTAASLRTFGVVVLPIGWNQGSELCLLMGVPLHRMTTEGCNQAASKLAANIMCRMHLWFTLQDDSKVGTKKFKSPFRTSKEMARLGGECHCTSISCGGHHHHYESGGPCPDAAILGTMTLSSLISQKSNPTVWLQILLQLLYNVVYKLDNSKSGSTCDGNCKRLFNVESLASSAWLLSP